MRPSRAYLVWIHVAAVVMALVVLAVFALAMAYLRILRQNELAGVE